MLVVLNVLPALEERIVDWLLARSGGGFTSFPVAGLSTRHDNLTAAEQVAGYQRRRQFNVQIPASEVDRFLNELRNLLGAADVRYWVLPVTRCGTFSDADEADRDS
jgi:hypothetical protein